MRPLLLLVLGVGLALAGSSAIDASGRPLAQRTPGAVGLSLRDGVGRAVVSRRGSFLVRVGRGRIAVTDLPDGPPPSVTCDRSGVRVSSSTVVYRGRAVSCRIFGGPWRVRMRGRNIDADGVVHGYLTLDREGARGRFSIDGGAYRLWPASRTRFRLAD